MIEQIGASAARRRDRHQRHAGKHRRHVRRPQWRQRHAVVIERARFDKLLAELIESDTKERAKIRGLDDQRKDQIVAGAVLVGELFERLDLKRSRSAPPPARRNSAGLSFAAPSRPGDSSRGSRSAPPQRARSGPQCDWHKTHSEQVTALCLRLFDQLANRCTTGAVEPRADRIRRAAARHRLAHRAGKGITSTACT